MNCPSILELTTEPRSDVVRQHVSGCLRCQALLAAWDADPVTDEPDVDLLDVELPVLRSRAEPRAAAAVGAVHTVAAPAQDVFLLGLVISHDEQRATIMPLTAEVHCAAVWDVVLDTDVLGYAVMVEAWNPVDVLREQLIEQLGVVSEPELFVELYERSQVGADAPEGLVDGPPITGEQDPRWLFREHERERVRPYGEPARAVTLGDSLGQVLRAMREERDATSEALANATGLDLASLKRIEEDREDLVADVPLKGFESLLAELDVPPSEMFFGYVEEAAFHNDRQMHHDQTPVYARRRLTAHVRQDRATEVERRTRAKAWVAQLRQRLEGEQ